MGVGWVRAAALGGGGEGGVGGGGAVEMGALGCGVGGLVEDSFV